MCMIMCMRTNIEIDDEALRRVRELTGAKTKREAVDLALKELIAKHQRIRILELRGKVRWEGDLEESRGART